MLALMAGANPSWVARQMGHVNPQMLFKVYARRIDGANRSRERDKLNAVWGDTRATETHVTALSVSEEGTILAEREGFEPSIQVLARMLP